MTTTKIIVKKINEANMHVDSDDRGVLMELYEFFSFWVPNYKHMKKYKDKIWDGQIHLYNVNYKTLYVGLFAHLKQFCYENDYELECIPCPVYGLPYAVNQNVEWNLNIPLSSRSKKITPNDYQIKSVNHALKNQRAVIISPTGSGKSLIIYMICRWFLQNAPQNKKLLLIVPTTSLVEQMFTDFEDYSEFDNSFYAEDEVHRIYSGKEKITNKRIIVSTWQSIASLPQRWFAPFQCVIGDEAHGFKAKSLTSIMLKCVNAKYRIGTTGTLDGAQCFDGDTFIETVKGKIPIRDINEGDVVYSVDEDSMSILQNVVIKKYNNGRPQEPMLKIVTENQEEIIVTSTHKIMTERGWVQAKDLRNSDKIYSIS